MRSRNRRADTRITQNSQRLPAKVTGVKVYSLPADAQSLIHLVMPSGRSRVRAALTYSIGGLFACGIVWACVTQIQLPAKGFGEVEFASPVSVVRSPDTGKILSIDVADGSKVKRGDKLIGFGPSEAGPARSASERQLTDRRALANRLAAAIEAVRPEGILRSIKISWAPGIPEDIQLRETHAMRSDLNRLAASLDALAEERRLALGSRDRFLAGIAAENEFIAVLKDQFRMRDDLAKRDYDSKAHVLDVLKEIKSAEITLVSFQSSLAEANAAISSVDARADKIRGNFIALNKERLSEAQRAAELAEKDLASASTQTPEQTLFAPGAGTVRSLTVNAAGQSVALNQELMQIVPEGISPEIVAFLPRSEIGSVEDEQDAVIKVDSASGDRNGVISGKVRRVIAAVTAGQEFSQAVTARASALQSDHGGVQSPLFAVLIAPSANMMTVNGAEVPLAQGMKVSVEIKTEKRRLIAYLISPFLKAASAAIREL